MNFIKNKAILVYAVVIILLITSALGYYKYTTNKIQKLEESVLLYKDLNESSQNTINELKEYSLKQTTELQTLHKKQKEIRTESKEREVIFSKHNLEKLAQKKPGLIQDRINSGSKRVFKELEDITSTKDD